MCGMKDLREAIEETVTEEVHAETAETVSPEVPAAPAAKKRGISAELYDWFDTLLYSVLGIIVIFTFFTRMSTVDGGSMMPTLEDGQHLMITDFLYRPAYNDIVVVWAERLPTENNDGSGKAIVKRVIGLPGDKITVDYSKGTVTRNGETLAIETKGDVLYEDGHMINTYTTLEEGLGGDFTVPDGCLFVMGDNRNGSTDSRSPWVGFVDMRDIIGKAYLRITPFDKFGGLY